MNYSVDPIVDNLLNLEYLRTVVYPILNSVALIVAVVGILAARFFLQKRRLEALFAIISIAATFFAYAGYWLGVFGEDMRAIIVRSAFPIFILAPAINSLLDLKSHITGKYKAWALTFHLRKPKR